MPEPTPPQSTNRTEPRGAVPPGNAGAAPLSRQHHQAKGLGSGAKLGLLALLLAAAAAAWWQWGREVPPPPASTPPALAAPAAPPQPDPAVTATPAEPAPEATAHPIEPAADAQGRPPLAADDGKGLAETVSEWLGREATLRFVATDDLARRTVATVDNLARGQAAVRLWPLHPVGGRMVVARTDDGGMTIAAENAARYDAVVGFVTGLNVQQGAALYRRVYPVLQQAYENLGYPGQRFNDRLVAVIDHLLATPDPTAPLALKLVQVNSQAQPGAQPQQPWLRYEFVDGELQNASAGQKILLRMGIAHTQRIKAQLRALRAQITKP
ncbi:MAG: DUF3014 domain-containing protein [Acidovorax sp.]|nr:DUF3014 domain-containing protein [Acidovorax sp.]